MTSIVHERLLEPGSGPLTVDDWFTLPDSPDRYELYEGMLIMAPPPDMGHQFIVTSIAADLVIAARKAGCVAFTSPIGVALTRRIGFEPDAAFLTAEHRNRLRKRGIEGAPDIVLEVLSPSTRKYDLETKLPAYLAAGVAEVWIADPVAERLTIHRPGETPESCAFGEQIPSRIVDIGAGGLGDLPEIPE